MLSLIIHYMQLFLYILAIQIHNEDYLFNFVSQPIYYFWYPYLIWIKSCLRILLLDIWQTLWQLHWHTYLTYWSILVILNPDLIFFFWFFLLRSGTCYPNFRNYTLIEDRINFLKRSSLSVIIFYSYRFSWVRPCIFSN